MIAPNSKFIWMDGKLVLWGDANVHILTHSLHYGTGVFEGVRCYKTQNGSAIFRHDEHIKRLKQSAHILGYEIPYSHDEIKKAMKETIRENELEECYIRPIAWLGTEGRGLNPVGISVHLAISAWEWGTYLGDEAIESGIDVMTSSFTRHHPNISLTKSKATGWYLNSVLAKKEAISNGYDEAILLDPLGNVAEGSGENIFIIRNGKLKTPPLVSVLEGITRASVIEIARDIGLEVNEEYFSRDEVYIADEAFFTGTAAELTPIRTMDKRTIGSGKRGDTTKKLQEIFFDALKGKSNKYKDWLDKI